MEGGKNEGGRKSRREGEMDEGTEEVSQAVREGSSYNAYKFPLCEPVKVEPSSLFTKLTIRKCMMMRWLPVVL